MKDDAITTFLSNPDSVSDSICQLLETVMSYNVQEDIKPQIEMENILENVPRNSVPVEIEPGETLNINPDLSHSKSKPLLKVLWEHKEAFSSEYTYMKRIPIDLCTYHKYIR